MKFVNRDVCGSSNIGTIWLGDRVVGWERPPSFVRPVKAGKGGNKHKHKHKHKHTSHLAPLSKQRVRAEKSTR